VVTHVMHALRERLALHATAIVIGILLVMATGVVMETVYVSAILSPQETPAQSAHTAHFQAIAKHPVNGSRCVLVTVVARGMVVVRAMMVLQDRLVMHVSQVDSVAIAN
jgi:hypothetical protein